MKVMVQIMDTSLGYWSGKPQRSPKNPGYYHRSKTLLLKTLHTLDAGHREAILTQTGKLSSCCPASQGIDAMQVR